MSFARATAGFVLLALLGSVPTALFAQPTYTLDTDPMRLGRRAWESLDFERAAAEFQRAIGDGYRVSEAEFFLGRVSEANGQFADALAHFRKAADLHLSTTGDDYPEARAEASLVLYDLGRMEASAMEARAAFQNAPRLWTAAYTMALHRLLEGEPEAGAELIETGAKLKGWLQREDLYHHAAALLALAKGNLDSAERHAAQAAGINPRRPAYQLVLARVYREKGIPALAMNAYEQAMSVSWFSPTAPQLTELGEIKEGLGRYNEARDHYLAAIAADSTFAPPTLKLADLFRRGGQTENAARTYQRYLSLEPDDVDALLVMVDLAGETGRTQTAADAALRAYAVDSSRVEVRRAVLRTGLDSRDTSTRNTALRVYSASDPAALTAAEHLSALTYFLAERRFEEAERSLEMATRLEPENADLRFQAGMMELKASRPDSAAARFTEAAALDSTRMSTFFNLGVALVRAERLDDALAPLARAVELDPTSVEGHLLLARTLVQVNSLEQAYRYYEDALRIAPDRTEAHMEAGYCAVLMGNFNSAQRHYRNVTEANPTSADAWAALGNAYLGLQDWQNAEEALGRARTLDPANAAMRRGFELLKQARAGG